MTTNKHRYYVCAQDFGKINCFLHLDYLEAIKSSKVHLSENTTQLNTIFPIKNKVNTLIPISNWVPVFFDRAIIEWELFNLLNVKFFRKV
jgi:hypothetical protein